MFLVGKIRGQHITFGSWVGFFPMPRVSHECLMRKWGLTLGDNSTGHCFVISDLLPTSFFHDCVTENACSRKNFDKVCLKVIRDTFFSNMWSVIRGQGDSIFCWG